MSTPSPFELSQLVGNKVAPSIQKATDTSAIDKILAAASEGGGQTDLIAEIIKRVSPQNQQAAVQLLQSKMAPQQQAQQQAQLGQTYESLGIPKEAAMLPEGERKEYLKGLHKGSDKRDGAQSALNILERQRELLEGGHLGPIVGVLGTGRKTGSTFTQAGRAARAEYEQLGKALISHATNIPIRNRLEFETLAHKLYDPTMTQEEIRGTLNAMERIIKNSLGSQGKEEIKETVTTEKKTPRGTIEKKRSLEEIFG